MVFVVRGLVSLDRLEGLRLVDRFDRLGLLDRFDRFGLLDRFDRQLLLGLLSSFCWVCFFAALGRVPFLGPFGGFALFCLDR